MKRFSTMVLLIAFCLMSLPASTSASKNTAAKQRVETREYQHASWAVDLGFLYAANCNPGPTDHTDGCVRFPLTRKDRMISLEIEDRRGQPVYAAIWNSSNQEVGAFCGKTERPFPHPGGDFIYIDIIATVSREECYPSTPTTGTVTATFTR